MMIKALLVPQYVNFQAIFSNARFETNGSHCCMTSYDVLSTAFATCCRPHLLRMAAKSLQASLPQLPDKPHHPKDFDFPKRSFGKTKPVQCSAQSQWYNTWPFLHYDEGRDVVYCHTCHSCEVGQAPVQQQHSQCICKSTNTYFIFSRVFHFFHIFTGKESSLCLSGKTGMQSTERQLPSLASGNGKKNTPTVASFASFQWEQN